MRSAMTPAAAGLLRSLLSRAGIHRDRILLTGYHSTDWQSLTYIGERHQFGLRLPVRDAAAIKACLLDRIEDVEWAIAGHIVADIGLESPPRVDGDGTVLLTIEALTIVE